MGEIPPVDNVSYLAIADHLVNGRLDDAVNGYWSPLFSWLLVPFALVPLSDNGSAFLIGIAATVLTVGRLRLLCRRLSADSRWSRTLIEILLTGTITYQVLTMVRLSGPDQLTALFLIAALVELLGVERSPRRRGLLVGGFSILAFLAKVTALPLMIGVMCLWLLVTVVNRRLAADPDPQLQPRATFRIALACLLVAAGFSSVILSVHYGEPTFSRSASYHAAITSPGAQGNPFEWAGLLAPANETAVSAWEDPSTASTANGERVDLTAPAENPSGRSSERGDTRPMRFVDNLSATVRPATLLAATVLVAAVSAFCALLHLVTQWWSRRAASAPVIGTVVVAMAVAMNVGGLALSVVNPRYLIGPTLLAVPIATWGLTSLGRRWQTFRGTVPLLLGVAVVVAIGSSIRPMLLLDQYPDIVDDERHLVESADFLRAGQRVASAELDLGLTGTCRLAGCTYWGAPVSTSRPALDEELSEAQIDVLVVSEESGMNERLRFPIVAEVRGVTLLDVTSTHLSLDET